MASWHQRNEMAIHWPVNGHLISLMTFSYFNSCCFLLPNVQAIIWLQHGRSEAAHFLCYFDAFSMAHIHYSHSHQALKCSYLYCELGGHDPNDPCDDIVLYQPVNISLSVFSLVLSGIFPLMLLKFVANYQDMWQFAVTNLDSNYCIPSYWISRIIHHQG